MTGPRDDQTTGKIPFLDMGKGFQKKLANESVH
jgi:hypothetical protein